MSFLPRRIDAAIAQKLFGYNVLWTTALNGKYEPHTESKPFLWDKIGGGEWKNSKWIIPHFSTTPYGAKLVIMKMRLNDFNHKLYHLPKNNLYISIFTDSSRLFKRGAELAEEAVCLSALAVYKEDACQSLNL